MEERKTIKEMRNGEFKKKMKYVENVRDIYVKLRQECKNRKNRLSQKHDADMAYATGMDGDESDDADDDSESVHQPDDDRSLLSD